MIWDILYAFKHDDTYNDFFLFFFFRSRSPITHHTHTHATRIRHYEPDHQRLLQPLIQVHVRNSSNKSEVSHKVCMSKTMELSLCQTILLEARNLRSFSANYFNYLSRNRYFMGTREVTRENNDNNKINND